MSWLLIGIFVILSVLGVPLAVALGSAVLVILFLNGIPLSTLPLRMYTSMNSFILVAVPLFILAGNLMEQGGMSGRIFNFANVIVGKYRGGLGHVNVVSGMIFGGISGSSVADVASLGPLLVRAMTEHRYPKSYAAALTMITATLASVIPPSILMIIAAVTANQSVGAALAGGLGPGIMIGFMLMLTNYLISVRRGYGEVLAVDFRQGTREMLGAVPALVTPVIILGGIFAGFVTSTEAAALAVVYTLLISTLAYRSLRWRELPGVLIRTGKTTGTILFIAMSASATSYIFTLDQLPAKFSEAILSVSTNKVVVILLMGVIFILVGTFMDIIAALLILVPVVTPTAALVGLNPIHFIVFMVAALAVGLSTPPVGVCLFTTAYVTRLSIEEITRAALIYYLVLLVALVLIALIPAITLWPTSLFGL